ncbi:hypothetical protein Taro_023309 [Colocasia esculenta]|uniref:Uncharacterized protein n=1 Tax=Colocasia esculenta TaxID=4460 RepID=A0A843V3V8_COLES|nr:hypothetical protein [Colocasia esculenta]
MPKRTPNDLGVPDQPRELCKRLNAAVLTTIFPFAPESVTRARLPPGVLPQQARGDGGPRQRPSRPCHNAQERCDDVTAAKPVATSSQPL